MIPKPHFYPRGGKSTSEVVIRCIVRVAGEQVYISTGHRCKVSDWSRKRERVRETARYATIVNDALERMEERLRGLLKNLYESGALTPDALRTGWAELLSPPAPPEPKPIMTLASAFETWKADNKDLRANETIRVYNNALHHLEGTLGRTRTQIAIDDIGLEVLQQMVRYLLRTQSQSTTSAWKSIRFLRAFLAWCQKRGMKVDPSFQEATRSAIMPDAPTTPSRAGVALLTSEFRQFRDHDLSEHPALSKARDAWIFQACVGLRWSDMQQLLREHRTGDTLDLTTIKNKKSVRIPLSRDARAIWDDYNGPPPAISNDKQNEYVKQAARLAGLDRRVRLVMYSGVKRAETTVMIWEVISTHVAKKTFVTSLIAAGCTVDDVMRVTGNSRRTIETYIRLDQEEVEAKVREKLDQR